MGADCKVLEGFFAWMVQVLLFFMAISALVFKRHYFERPQRPMQVWLMDIGKQSGAAGFAHVLNLLLAYLLYTSQKGQADQCAWYFINYFVDTTLGIPLAWFYLQLLQTVATRFDWYRIANTGDYGNPPSYRTWMYQILAWELVVLLMKSSLGMVLYVFRKPLSIFGIFVSRPIAGSPEAELLLVMVLCPCIMNMVQFWIFDSLLKMKIRAAGTEPLNQLASDDADDVMKTAFQVNIHPPIELANAEKPSRFSSFLKKGKPKKEESRGLINSKEGQDEDMLEIVTKEGSPMKGKEMEIEGSQESEDDEVDLLLEEEEDTLSMSTGMTTTTSPSVSVSPESERGS